MDIITNNDNIAIGTKQARYFAIQVFSGMKQYLAEHRAEYEEWLANEATNAEQ